MERNKIEDISELPTQDNYTGDMPISKPNIVCICYNNKEYYYKKGYEVDILKNECRSEDMLKWCHLEPISDSDSIRKICSTVKLHPLIAEDILSVEHRPKIDDYEDYLFIILDTLFYKNRNLEFNHMAFVIKQNTLYSFSDKPINFQNIYARIEKSSGRLRQKDILFLLYSIIDNIMDGYFKVLETIGEEIEVLEDDILENPTKESVEHIHNIKRTLMKLRHSLWPLREIINKLINSDFSNEENHLYFKDLYDHTIQVLDTIEGYKDTVSGFLDIYLSTLSNRMNEIMKTLSIVSTIFIPLSFMTGYYGMNFKYESILQSRDAYTWNNILMLIIPILMLLYFKKRKWF